jgi:asparagine synthase (glutamine-hydrolysing)
LQKQHNFKGNSDNEIIPHYYQEFGFEDLCKNMSGKFGVVIYDSEQQRFFVGRDHLGIIPVYIGRGKDGEFFVCSELKAFHDFASTSIEILLPGKKIIFFF